MSQINHLPHFQHVDTVRCPHCGKTGSITWEDDPRAGPPELIGIDGDFYERIARKTPYAIKLVCRSCGTIQDGAKSEHFGNAAKTL